MAICADSARMAPSCFSAPPGGGGQLGVLFGQRIKRGFLLTFFSTRCLFSVAICADGARGLILLFLPLRGGGGQLGVLWSAQSAPTARGLSHPAFLCRFGSARSSRFSRQRIDRRFLRFSLAPSGCFRAAICTDSAGGPSSFSAPLDSGGQLGVLFTSASSAVVCPLSFCARCAVNAAICAVSERVVSSSFLRRFAAAASSAFFAQRAHGGSFAALFCTRCSLEPSAWRSAPTVRASFQRAFSPPLWRQRSAPHSVSAER
ncbi:MAG: hypothetical protein ACLR17_05065 [Enterobacteriaceae bacterium]